MNSTAAGPKPLYLLADSQLLFWHGSEEGFLNSLREQLGADRQKITKAAYIGASNNDDPVFFELFVAAVDQIDTHDSRMIKSVPSEKDRDFLMEADLVLLAGGDFAKGWFTLQENGVAEIVREKYINGALIIGVSAGAVQLGIGAYADSTSDDFVETFQLVPHYIDCHEEDSDWNRLKQTIMKRKGPGRAYGLPSGGGLVYHPDLTVEPIRHPVNEFFAVDSDVESTLLYPNAERTTPPPAEEPHTTH